MISVTRIFWISKFANKLLGQKQSIYHSAIAILVETSLVYSVCLLLYLLYPSASPRRTYLIIICLRIVGITPTLLIVQVGMGGIKHKTNVPATLSKFQVRTNSVVLDTLHTSIAQDDGGSRRTGYWINPQDEEADIAMQELPRDDRPKSVFEPLTVDIRTNEES